MCLAPLSVGEELCERAVVSVAHADGALLHGLAGCAGVLPPAELPLVAVQQLESQPVARPRGQACALAVHGEQGLAEAVGPQHAVQEGLLGRPVCQLVVFACVKAEQISSAVQPLQAEQQASQHTFALLQDCQRHHLEAEVSCGAHEQQHSQRCSLHCLDCPASERANKLSSGRRSAL